MVLLMLVSLLSMLLLTSKVLTCFLFAFIFSSAVGFPFIVGVVAVFLKLAFL
jgi:hypothetical protein